MKLIKVFVLLFILALLIMIVLDLPSVKKYIQKETKRAQYEMFMMQNRYERAVKGI